jgi:quercetin dioxygenase-like cupin family protein
MTNSIPQPVLDLIVRAESRTPLGTNVAPESWTSSTDTQREDHYCNKNERLDIDFSVQRAEFPQSQTIDTRIIEIAPGSRNERHKHAHESLFFVLDGEGEVLVGEDWSPVKNGDLAFVPRWIMHQTRNTSENRPLRILAITDFGFTSAVLGNYDRRTRLKHAGQDAG